MPLVPFLHRVTARENLSAEDAHKAMEIILSGDATNAQIAAYAVALRMKGETAGELLGSARAMRERAHKVEPSPSAVPLIDTCGTGGEGPSTFNISTVAAFVVAGAGARVAKHGNRSMSTPCGSADILESLGARIDLTPGQIAQCIDATSIGFLFAPALHPAMKHARPARTETRLRTIFNLLGPLTNPAGARTQLIGAPSERAADLMAQALAGLGTDHAFVVHGFDGMDEITTSGPTLIFEVKGPEVQKHVWTPADFGIAPANLADLAGGDPTRNSSIARSILDGETGPQRDIVLVNSAAALVAAGVSAGLLEGMDAARRSIDSGAARLVLSRFVDFTVHAGTICPS